MTQSDEPAPGKGRRWLKTLVVVLVVAALLVALVAWLAQTDLVRGRVLDLARARLSETLARDVEIGDLEYSVRPLQVVATDVVIPGSRPGEPFAVIPRVRVEVGFEGFFRPTLTIEEVEISRPEVWLTFYDDGTTSLPEVRTGGGGGRLEVVIGHLLVEDGVVHLDQREIPLEVDASPVRVVAEGPGATALPDDHLVAQFTAQEVSTLLPDAERWGGSATARVEVSPGRVEVTRGLLSGPDLTARFEAVYAFGDEAEGGRHGEVEVRARGRAALANRLGYLDEPISGPFRFVGEIQLSDTDGTRYGGTLTSEGIDFLERTFEDITAEVDGGDEGLVVQVQEAGYAGGILVGTLTLPSEGEDGGDAGEADAEGRAAHLEAQARNLVLARVVDDLDLEDTFLAGLRGRAGAELTYRFRTDAAQSGSGEGTLRLSGVEGASADGRLPVSGRVPLVIRNGLVLVQDARLEAPGQVLTASGNYDLPSGTGSFQYRLVSEDLGRLARTVPLPPELTADGTPLWMVESGTGTVEGRVSLGPAGDVSVEASGELANLRTGLADFDRVRAPIRLEDGVLSIRDGLLENRAQRLELSGSYDLERGTAEGEFRLSSDDLGELGDLAAALLPAEAAPGDDAAAATDADSRPPWLPSGGEGTVEGSLRRTADGALSGRVELELADVDLPAPAADGTGGVRLDRLAGSFRLRPGEIHDLRMEATSGGGALMASGSLPLPTSGAADPDAWQREPFQLDLDVVDWPVSTLTALAAAGGEPLEASGRVTLEADLGGTFRRPEGNVQVAAEPFSVAGFDFQRLRAEIGLDGPRVVVDSARLVTPAGAVVAAGSWNRVSGALDGRVATAGAGEGALGDFGDLDDLGDLTAAGGLAGLAGVEGLSAAGGLDLAEPPLAELLPGSLQGRIALVADVGGTVDSPVVELVSATQGLRVDGRTLGEDGVARLAATWADDRLQAEGSLLGLVGFSGGGLLSTEAADLALNLSVDDVDALVRLVSEQPVEGLGGTVAGTLTVEGRFDAPAGPAVELLLDPVRLTFEGRRIENIEPVELALAPGKLEVRSFFVSMPDQRQSGELFLVGSVGLEEPYELDLRLQAEMSARWLELLVDESEMEGRIQALATVGGTVAEPRLDGQGEILDGEMVFAAFPHALEDLEAVALFYPDRLVVDRVNARLGGGRLRAEGRIGLPGEMSDDVTYRFQAQLDDASLRVPEGFLIRGDANLTLVSSDDGRLISGVVDLERAFYLQDVPVGVTQLLRTVFEPTRLDAGTADPVLAETQLNVAVRGPGALRVRNNVADLTGDVDLVVRGSLADPALFGQVELDAGGEVVYSENEYEVERGLITFSNPYRIDPVIDFVATTEVRNYDITLNLSGTLDRLQATFSSDPPLANLEVVSLLTVGRPIDEGALTGGGAVGGGGGAAGAAENLLYGQAASLLSERVNTLFGFDRFRVTPATGATSGSGLAVTVGQQISRDVYVTYSRDPALPEVDIVQVEWQVYDNVVVVLTSNGDRTYTLDVQIENRF